MCRVRSRRQANIDIWLIRAGEDCVTSFTFECAIYSGPLWSPDGSRIVSSNISRRRLLPLRETGRRHHRRTSIARHAIGEGAAQDAGEESGRSRSIEQRQDPKTGTDLWALPMTGERNRSRSCKPRFDDIQGQFSPDGRWLTYASNESGRDEIYVQTFPDTGGNGRFRWPAAFSRAGAPMARNCFTSRRTTG